MVEEGGRGAGQGGAGRESVQVAYTLTRLADVVEEPAKKGLVPLSQLHLTSFTSL